MLRLQRVAHEASGDDGNESLDAGFRDQAGVLFFIELAHVFDLRAGFLGERFDYLLVTGGIASAVSQKGHEYPPPGRSILLSDGRRRGRHGSQLNRQ